MFIPRAFVLLAAWFAVVPRAAGADETAPSWLSFVAEMQSVSELDLLRGGKPWSSADDAKYAEDVKGAKDDWRKRLAKVEPHVNPQRAKSLSRWAVRQMADYAAVPALKKVELKPLGTEEKQGRLVLEGTIDTLPTHSQVVTRWLKVFVLYDTHSKAIVHVTVTIRGEKRE